MALRSEQKITIFEDSTFSGFGGGQVVTVSVARFFKESGYDVTLCDHKIDGVFHDKIAKHIDRHVKLHGALKRYNNGQHASKTPPLLRNFVYFAIFIINVALFLLRNRSYKTDIYYSATRHSHILVFFINIFRKRRWIVHVHSNEKRPFLKKIMRFIFTRADKVLFVSNYLQDFYRLSTGFVVYNPVDELTQFKSLREREKRLSIGFVGNLFEWKGIYFFLAACADLHRDKKDLFSFNVFGGGDNISDLREQFPFVNFAGLTPRNEIYQNIDVLVLPSIDAESCPMVILEALTFNIICITTNFGGQKELVDYFGGITIQPFSQLEIATAIERVRNNYANLRKSLIRAREIPRYKGYKKNLRLIFDDLKI
ncbi:glycosyltransferase family 4 protein [Paracoccaceae bacterium]|nr:glycosyltransferase family 4 protein [Paracoccaceae bacterium]